MLVLCYPRCGTCKKALKWLDDNGFKYEYRHIVEDNPSKAELKEWYEKSGLPLKRFFNTSGLKYKELGLKDKIPGMTEDEVFDLLSTDGMLVKRPILIEGDKVLVGFKEALNRFSVLSHDDLKKNQNSIYQGPYSSASFPYCFLELLFNNCLC